MGEEPRLWGAETPEQEASFKAIIDERVSNAPFYSLVGLVVVGLAPGEAHLELKAGPRLSDSSGTVARGVIASLADAASGVAVATWVPLGSKQVVTIEQKVNFMAPVTTGDLSGIGKVVYEEGDIAVSEAEIRDGDGVLVARSTATHMLV